MLQAASLFERIPERLKRAPGAERVVLADAPPFTPVIGMSTFTIRETGRPDVATIFYGAARSGSAWRWARAKARCCAW